MGYLFITIIYCIFWKYNLRMIGIVWQSRVNHITSFAHSLSNR